MKKFIELTQLNTSENGINFKILVKIDEIISFAEVGSSKFITLKLKNDIHYRIVETLEQVKTILMFKEFTK